MIRVCNITVEAPKHEQPGEHDPVRIQLMVDRDASGKDFYYYRVDTREGHIRLTLRQLHCLKEAVNIITHGTDGVSDAVGHNPLVAVMRAFQGGGKAE